MGYDSYVSGEIAFQPPLTPTQVGELQGFAATYHASGDLPASGHPDWGSIRVVALNHPGLRMTPERRKERARSPAGGLTTLLWTVEGKPGTSSVTAVSTATDRTTRREYGRW